MNEDNFLDLSEQEWREFMRFVTAIAVIGVVGLLALGGLIAYAAWRILT